MSKGNSEFSRRAFLRASAVLAAGAALAACTPATAPAGGESTTDAAAADAATEATTITYWTFWADRWGEFQQKIVDDYNANGKDGIQVDMLIVPWGDLSTKLLTAVAAGNPPDFTIINRSEVVEWAVRDGLLPLDEHISASTESKPDDWFAVAWNECVWQGKTFAQPFESGT